LEDLNAFVLKATNLCLHSAVEVQGPECPEKDIHVPSQEAALQILERPKNEM